MKNKYFLSAVIVIAVAAGTTAFVIKLRRPDTKILSRNQLHTKPLAVARLAAPPNLERLSHDSAVIVVGRVSALLDAGPEREKSYLVTVVINKILKGSLNSPTIRIKLVREPNTVLMATRIQPSFYGIFFLNEQSPNLYALTDQNLEAMPASQRTQSSRGEVLDEVVNEVGGVLNSMDNSPSDQLLAAVALALVDSPASNQALRQGLTSKDESVKLEAQVGLLRHGDVSLLAQIEDTLMKLPADVADNRVLRLSSGIEDGIEDFKAIPSLTRLLNAPNARVRQAASYALRKTRSVSAMVPLSAALNDNDQMVRYNAVAGLAEITGDFEHEPSVDLFKREESNYLTYWRQRTSTKTQ